MKEVVDFRGNRRMVDDSPATYSVIYDGWRDNRGFYLFELFLEVCGPSTSWSTWELEKYGWVRSEEPSFRDGLYYGKFFATIQNIPPRFR